MKILLKQVITGEEGHYITVVMIDHTIDCEADAQAAVDAIKGFDAMADGAGYFNDNDHIFLEINGNSIGYKQIDTWEGLIEFLGGEVN